MPSCTSCGSDIPEGQGRSCSMCYGDVGWGRDGYYQEWIDQQIKEEQEKDLREFYQQNLDNENQNHET